MCEHYWKEVKSYIRRHPDEREKQAVSRGLRDDGAYYISSASIFSGDDESSVIAAVKKELDSYLTDVCPVQVRSSKPCPTHTPYVLPVEDPSETTRG